MKYSNTAITQLTRWYKQILIKCAIFNAAILLGGAFVATPAMAETITERQVFNSDTILNSPSATNIQSVGRGGVIFSEHALTINKGVFDGNSADAAGVLYDNSLVAYKHQGTHSVTISDSEIKNNQAGDFGAIAIFSPQSSVKGSTFTNNKATADYAHLGDGAGALMLGSESQTVISNSTFTGNSSGTIGGAVETRPINYWLDTEYSGKGTNSSIGGKVDILSSTFVGNSAGTRGGAFFNSFYNSVNQEGYAYVADSTFIENTADRGGAIFNEGWKDASGNYAKLYIKDSSFTNNSATSNGGAIFNESQMTIAATDSNVTFSGNTANNVANDIYNTGTLNLNAASGKTISLEGGIDGEAGIVNLTGVGTVDVAGNIANQTVTVSAGELALSNGVADGSNLSGSTVTVANGAIINTIDDVINDYMTGGDGKGTITLANGASIKGDVNFLEGTADKYAAASGASVKYSVGNLLGSIGKGEKTIQVASDGATVDISQAKFTTETGLTFASSGTNDGNMIVKGMTGGIEDAADESEKIATIDYQLTDDESVNTAKSIHDVFVLTGAGVTADSKALTLNADLGVVDGADLTVNNLKLEGDAALTNSERGVLRINDSSVNVAVNNAGTLISDPTTYYDDVTNTGTASFDGDTFASGSSLTNSGTVSLSGAMTFDTGSTLIGNAGNVLNIVSGTTAFNGTSDGNNVYVANGANFSGALKGGSVNTQNNNIDTITGSVSNSALYMDANLKAGTSDKFGTGSSGTIKSINLTSSEYGNADSKTIDLGSDYTLDSDLAITGAMNYYTDVKMDGTNLVFSDKLINTSGLYNKIGSWTNGNYIKNNVDMDHPADETHLTVGSALTALDTQVKNNADAIATKQAQLKNDASTSANIDATVLTSIRATDSASDTALVTEKAIATKLATKQDTLTAGNGIDITSNTVSVKAADGTVVVGTDGVKVGTIQTANIAKNAVTTGKIADGAVNSDKLSTGVKNNMLMNATSSDGLTITGGNGSTKANIALKLASTGGLEENATNGLQIKEGGVQLAMMNADAMTSAAVDAGSTGTKLVNETSLGATRGAIETKLAAGASGYDIDAKTLKVQGNNVLSAADVAGPYSGTTIDEANAYIETNAGKFANVGTTAGVINTIFKDKQDWLDGTLGITSANPDAVKTAYTGTNYLANATTLTGADKLLDKTINDVSTIVGPAQTTAATTGQFVGRKIGADINLVNAVDELGRNMVSLTADNTFTGLNTFKNEGGIVLEDGAGDNSTRLKATADGLEINRAIVAKNGVKMGTNTVTSIDTDGTTVTSAATAANVMATSATVYNGAENGLYDGVKVKGDTTAIHTIKTAIGATNNALNALTTTAGNEVDSAKVDVQWNSTDSTLATVLGNGDYSSNNYVEDGASVTTVVGALDTALKTTNDTIGARAIETGTAGTLAGKTIGTAAGNISVVDALETLNATNVSQNGSLNTLAGLINGQGVDAATGALTGTATTLSNKFAATNLTAAANELLTDITVTTDGNYIKADKTAAENLGILDGQIKAYTDKVEVVGDPEAAKVADGGLLNNRAITGDTTVDGHITLVQAVRDISATAAGKALNNTFTGNNEFQGTTTFTGATQFNNASNTFGATSGSQVIIDNGGNVQVDKKLKLGGANAISGSENTLDMGKNALTNVAGLTLVNGSADVALNADASGNLVVDNGVIANSFTVGTTGKGFDALGNASTGTLKIGDANAITGTSNALNMNGNDLTNVKDLSVRGKATVGTLAAGATTISAEGATAGTPVSALSVTAENTGDGTSTSFNVTSDGVSVVGQTNLQNTKVQGDLVISDGTNDYTITADSVNAKAYGSTDNYDAYDVLGVSADMFVDGLVATNDGLSVFKDDDGLGNYSEVFGVDNEGSIVSDLIKADNSETGNTITLGKDANTATSVTGTLTADGESKFAKDASDVYSLDVTNSAVTANKEIDANAGVKFGTATDEKVMTSVEQGAVAALNATGNDQKLVSAQSLAATRNAINADTRKVMGSMYNINDDKTVSYNNAALAGTNGFATGAQSLTGALTKFANNVQAAMGTTYAENGTYTNGFAKPDAVDYDGLATNQSLVAAISQLDKNIGTAIAGTDRSSDAFDTSATKTVNENIAALDAAIGGDVENEYNGVLKTKAINQNIDAISATLGRMDNLSTEAKTTDSEVVIRGNLTNANNTPLTADLTVADALSNLDKTLGRIHGLYDGTKVNVTDSAYPSVTGANSNLAKGTTVENHLVSLDNAIGSRNIASANEDINTAVNGDATAAAGTEARNGSLALGLQTVGDKIGDMDFTSTHYITAGSDLSSSVKTLDSNLYRIEEDVRDLKRDFNRGMASMAAMSALVPNPRAAGNTSLSIGTGAYSGHTAMAIGGFHHINDNVMLNAGAAWGNSRDVAYRLGVTWSW